MAWHYRWFYVGVSPSGNFVHSCVWICMWLLQKRSTGCCPSGICKEQCRHHSLKGGLIWRAEPWLQQAEWAASMKFIYETKGARVVLPSGSGGQEKVRIGTQLSLHLEPTCVLPGRMRSCPHSVPPVPPADDPACWCPVSPPAPSAAQEPCEWTLCLGTISLS